MSYSCPYHTFDTWIRFTLAEVDTSSLDNLAKIGFEVRLHLIGAKHNRICPGDNFIETGEEIAKDIVLLEDEFCKERDAAVNDLTQQLQALGIGDEQTSAAGGSVDGMTALQQGVEGMQIKEGENEESKTQ